MILSECPQCGSEAMFIGRAETQHGRTIYPNCCGDCSAIFATQQATAAEVVAWEQQHGRPNRVYTRTEERLNRGEEVSKRIPHGKPCEACGSLDKVEAHHWAPAHLFGIESNKWPVGFLCQPCHARWHRIVTPEMGKQKGASSKHYDAVKAARQSGED